MSSKWMPQGLGATPGKTVALGGLLLLLGVVFYVNFLSDDTPAAPARPAAPNSVGVVTTAVQMQPATRTAPVNTAPRSAPRRGKASQDYKVTMLLPEDLDLTTIDPNLRQDLLAKVRNVGDVGGRRSLFEYYTPPPPPPPPVKITPAPPPPTPPKVTESKPAAPVKPPPPPIPLKYFGYQGRPQAGQLKALFLDTQGEDPYLVAAGDIIKNRYRIVRVGITSAEVEDTVEKNTQTLKIVEACEETSQGCK